MPVEILLVEDNPGDVLLVRKAMETVFPDHRLHVAVDGLEAAAFLFHPSLAGNSPRPDLIILDLNLPRMSGRELIAQMQADGATRTIPLVILTSSQRDQGVLAAWDERRCLYIVKPSSFAELQRLFRQLPDLLAAAASETGANRGPA